MNILEPAKTLQILAQKAKDKTKFSLAKLFLLSVLGGAFIALGYLAFVRATGTLPKEWGSMSSLIGGAVFPIGLMAIVLVGGELTTGNMMTMTIGVLQKKVTISDLVKNWAVVMLGNMIGGILVAFLFGHIVGLTEGAFLAKTLAVADGKVADSPLVALVSAIGCNIFVCMAVWMGTGAQDGMTKFFSLWFPVMIFVTIGFQHVVANAFIIPAAMFSGESSITVMDFLSNFLWVFIGNGIGGALCIALPVHLMYKKPVEENNTQETLSDNTVKQAIS